VRLEEVPHVPSVEVAIRAGAGEVAVLHRRVTVNNDLRIRRIAGAAEHELHRRRGPGDVVCGCRAPVGAERIEIGRRLAVVVHFEDLDRRREVAQRRLAHRDLGGGHPGHGIEIGNERALDPAGRVLPRTRRHDDVQLAVMGEEGHGRSAGRARPSGRLAPTVEVTGITRSLKIRSADYCQNRHIRTAGFPNGV